MILKNILSLIKVKNKNKSLINITFIDYVLRYIYLNHKDYQLLFLKDANSVYLLHLSCKQIILSSVYDLIYKSSLCDDCRIKSLTDKYKSILYDNFANNYKLLDEVYLDTSKVRIMHKSCNLITIDYAFNINRFFICEYCKPIRDKQSYVHKLKEKYNSKYTLISDFNGMNEESEFICNNCNNIITTTPYKMLHNGKCDNCINKLKTIKFKKKLNERYNSELTLLSDYTGSLGLITIQHNKCGHIYETSPYFLQTKNICPVCNSIENIESNPVFNNIYKKSFNDLVSYIKNSNDIVVVYSLTFKTAFDFDLEFLLRNKDNMNTIFLEKYLSLTNYFEIDKDYNSNILSFSKRVYIKHLKCNNSVFIAPNKIDIHSDKCIACNVATSTC